MVYCFLLLMLVAQQVVHGLHWVKGGEGYLYEDGVPIAHGTIPEARQLKRFE
jgi:hypothetical protein